MTIAREEFELGGHKVTLETGKVARQASGAVMAYMGGTAVLCTVVANREAKPGQSFFPLTVDYQERMYAGGRIPGGFFKREGRPSEKETLTCRLIDRPIRPLFPKGFLNDVHVVATVMSAEKDINPDVNAMIGASAALSVSGVPFKGPVGAARVGFIDGLYVLNPSTSELENSRLNMVVAGTKNAVLMVESEADELSEDQMLGAVLFGHQEMQVQIDAIQALTEKAGKERWVFTPPPVDEPLAEAVANQVGEQLGEAYKEREKTPRQEKIRSLRSAAVEALVKEDEGSWNASDVEGAFSSLEKQIVRHRVLDGDVRIDGRAHDRVRDLSIEIGVLPKVHGSAFFQRGETQAIVSTTLGTSRDAPLIESLEGSTRDSFLLHYNFPPYSVGEAGFMGGPKRREIGHGRLARRAISAMLPSPDDFPYTIRVVSEITESNGSSSMASVCGASLALMDAGVPMKAPVAGVAMGLVLEGERAAILTDILGDEDHLGDMDFKVAGTSDGVTALQMDIKIEGITESIMEQALEQALSGRQFILGRMNQIIDKARPELSQNAPAIHTIQVKPDKVREIIGKGGSVIRSIQEESGAEIEIEDDGTVRVFAADHDSMSLAVSKIEAIVAEAEVGKIYKGKVSNIMDYGAFVNILPGKDGLVHISQIANERIERVADHLEVGQEIEVVVRDIDQRGKISLSMKDLVKTEEVSTV